MSRMDDKLRIIKRMMVLEKRMNKLDTKRSVLHKEYMNLWKQWESVE